MSTIRVLLADDHRIMREGLQSLLSHAGDIELVGQAATGKEVLGLLGRTRPEVVVMDLHMPEMDGLETTRFLNRHFPGVKVLVLTMVDSANVVERALAAGARGFVSKDSGGQELAHAIRQVAAGLLNPGHEADASVLHHQASGTALPQGRAIEGRECLSPREREVLELISEGHGTQEIADKLGLGKRTIDSHRQSLMLKSGAKNTAALVRYAFSNGLLSP